MLNTFLVSCADTGHSNPTRAVFFVRVFNAVRREPKTPPNKFFCRLCLFELIFGSGIRVSFAEREHRMRHNNKNKETG
ncbi:MAG TPA: hypothetical protein DCY17_00690 [Clostridiales bacterium]|nr:hypothetical protein [Clostridiales bacterium]